MHSHIDNDLLENMLFGFTLGKVLLLFMLLIIILKDMSVNINFNIEISEYIPVISYLIKLISFAENLDSTIFYIPMIIFPLEF